MKKTLKFLDNKFFFNFFEFLYKNFLIIKASIFIKKYKNFEFYLLQNKNDIFTSLCEKYGSDKGGMGSVKNNRIVHFYSSYYHNFYKNIKDDVKLVFECGIGTTNENITANMTKNGNPGASLRVLRDYFKNAKIYGADIDKNILFSSDRIKTYYVNQLDKTSIQKMWNLIDKDYFDLIIDDGMHNFKASYNLFNLSFSKLKKNGVYVIEDVNISYLVRLVSQLKRYNPKIISANRKNNIDDYLLLIKKH